MKQFTKSFFLMLAALFSFSFAFAETGTEKEPSSGITKDADIKGQCYTLAGSYNAGAGSTQAGNMTSKGVKLRTGSDGARAVFTVNTNYTITKFVGEGISNYDQADGAEDDWNVKVTKVEVDGVEVAFSGGEFPAKGAGTSGNITIEQIQATQSIAIYFDNSNSKGSQINFSYALTWERPDATQPTIEVTPSAVTLVPTATYKLSAYVDPAGKFTTQWASSNEAVATVAEDGTVTAVAAGAAEIYHQWADNTDIKDTAVINVAAFDPSEYSVIKEYDFKSMGDVTLTIQETAAGKIWNEANKVANNVFFCTNTGLEDIAVQAVLSKSKGWSITSSGLTLGGGAGRCAAIGNLEAGQIVEIIYTGQGFYTGSKNDVARKDDGAAKTAMNEGVGRAIYKMDEAGLFGFEIIKGYAIEKIVVYGKEYDTEDSWIKTDIASLATGDVVVIVDQTSSTAMLNSNGTSSAPTATEITLNEGLTEISGEVASNLQWQVTVAEGGYQFAVPGTTDYLYTTNTNNGVRVGTNTNNVFSWVKADANSEENFLQNNATSRYIGVYNKQDWRCYTTVNNNIKATVTAFYKKAEVQVEVAVSRPTITLESGTYVGTQSVEITCPTNGATIYYTLDGTDPTAESTAYTEAVSIEATATLKAIAIKGEDSSKIATATYTILESVANTAETAKTVAEAIALIDAKDAETLAHADNQVFVKGTVAQVDGFNENYKSITYWISEDGTTTSMLQCYSGKGIDGADFAAVEDVAVGAEVIVKGNLKKFGDTYEFDKNNQLVSYEVVEEVSIELTNADFEKSTPLDNHLCGYGKDMEKNGTTYYGLTDVTGWNKVVLSGNADGGFEGSGMGGGVFAYGSEYQVKGNNKTAPAAGPTTDAKNCLAFFAVWGCGGYYTQDITLPAGEYTLTFPMYSQSGEQANESYTGFFVKDSDVKYTVAVNPTVGSWANQSVTFTLAEETAGEIRIGYKSTGSGSGANPMLFIDGVKIDSPLLAALDALNTEIENAEALLADKTKTEGRDDLQGAISAAKEALSSTDVDEITAAIQTLKQAEQDFEDANFQGFKYQKYIVQNIASGRYFGAGSDWGTQATLVEHPEYVKLDKQTDGTYYLESQVNYGGTSYYFNGDYMDNATPVALTITEVSEGKYTIANGEIYYGWDGTSYVLGKNLAADSENAIWTIVSLDDAKAALANASIDAPMDATLLIEDHDFGRNNRYVNRWTMEASNQNLSGGNNVNNCAESYHSAFTLSQTLADAPKGIYAMTAQGFYRQDGTDEENLPYFYANNETQTFPLKTGAENSMSDASVSFTNGLYTIDPIYVEVTEAGALTIGAKNENTNVWAIFDNFVLTYYGAEATLDQVKNARIIKELADLRAKAEELAAQVEVQAVKNTLQRALDSSANVTGTEAINAAIETLKAAIDVAEASLIAKDVLPKMKAFTETTNFYTADAFNTYYTEPAAKYEAGTMTKVEATGLQDPEAVTGWHAANTVDDLLMSVWDVEPMNWVSYHVNTWSNEGATDGSNFGVPFVEYWTEDANSLPKDTLTATISGLEQGDYTVKAWVRVRAKNDETDPSGITMLANDGEAVDVTEGAQIGTSQLFLQDVVAEGTVAEDGTLTVKFIVAADNNISWLAFKNMMFEKKVVEVTHTWDFTKWSEATVANLKAEAAKGTTQGLWSDQEKADSTAKTKDISIDNCFWQVGSSNAAGETLTANGEEIAELKGLLFTNNKERSLAIAVNYGDCTSANGAGFGPYHGPAYLWLGGMNIEYFTIPAVKGGTTIKMGVESHKLTDARGVQLLVNGTALTDATGATVSAPKEYTEQTWQVPAGEACNVVVKNTNGCHIYFIDAEQDEEALQSISTVKVNNLDGTIYNLNGQKVNKAQKGLYIINGKKVVIK